MTKICFNIDLRGGTFRGTEEGSDVPVEFRNILLRTAKNSDQVVIRIRFPYKYSNGL